MIGRLVALSICAVFLVSTAAFATDTLRPDQIAAIDAGIRHAMRQHHIPSVVLAVEWISYVLFRIGGARGPKASLVKLAAGRCVLDSQYRCFGRDRGARH